MRGFITDPKAHGGLRLVDDLPEPVAADDQVLVDVRAYSVNRGELFLLKLRPDGWRPGQDLAGVVVQAAADGTGPAVGTRVVGLVDWECWAERVAVKTGLALTLPDEVSFEVAASLPIAGLTALRAIRQCGTLLGKRVLVTGATGGVGQFVVQLALAAGAHVTALVSGPDRVKDALVLGAHEALTALDRETAGTFHAILDGVGGQTLTDSLHLLIPGGRAITYGTVGGPASLALLDFPPGFPCQLIPLYHAYPLETRGDDLAILVSLVSSGQLKPLLGAARDWGETLEVLEALRNRVVRGKAVLIRS
jgi:NADPH:quinone reductase